MYALQKVHDTRKVFTKPAVADDINETLGAVAVLEQMNFL